MTMNLSVSPFSYFMSFEVILLGPHKIRTVLSFCQIILFDSLFWIDLLEDSVHYFIFILRVRTHTHILSFFSYSLPLSPTHFHMSLSLPAWGGTLCLYFHWPLWPVWLHVILKNHSSKISKNHYTRQAWVLCKENSMESH